MLDSTTWEGPDAQHFRSAWSGTHTAALNQVIQAIKDAGVKATKNATEQDQASRQPPARKARTQQGVRAFSAERSSRSRDRLDVIRVVKRSSIPVRNIRGA